MVLRFDTPYDTRRGSRGKSLQYPPDSGLNFEPPIEVLIQMWIHLGTWVKGRVRQGRERDVCFCF